MREYPTYDPGMRVILTLRYQQRWFCFRQTVLSSRSRNHNTCMGPPNIYDQDAKLTDSDAFHVTSGND